MIYLILRAGTTARNIVSFWLIGLLVAGQVQAQSAVSDFVWVTNVGSGTVVKINKVSNAIVATVAVGVSPNGIAVGPDSVWVSNQGSNNVSRINKSSGIVTATIPVGLVGYASGVAVDPDFVWVTSRDAGTISKIDKTNNGVVTFATSSLPFMVAVDQDFVWITSDVAEGRLLKVDKDTNAELASILLGGNPIAVSVDQDFVWVANRNLGNVAKIDRITNSVTTIALPNGANPNGITVDDESVWVASQSPSQVDKIDKNTNMVTATFTGPDLLNPIALAADENSVWVTNPDVSPEVVTRIDKLSSSVIASVDVSPNIRPIGFGDTTGLAYDRFFSADPEPLAYVSSTQGLFGGATPGVVQIVGAGLPLPAVTGTILSPGVGSGQLAGDPSGMAFSPDGSTLYVGDSADTFITIINTSDNTLAGNINAGAGTLMLAVSPDGSALYATGFQADTLIMIDTAAPNSVTAVPVGNHPVGVAVKPDGNRLYVSNFFDNNVKVIDPALIGISNPILATVSVDPRPGTIAIEPDGSRLWISHDTSNVSIVDTALSETSPGTAVTTINVGGVQPDLEISPDGTKVYVAVKGSNKVSVIDTTTLAIVDIPVFNPTGIGVSPDGLRAVVTDNTNHGVHIIDFATQTVGPLIATAVDPRNAEFQLPPLVVNNQPPILDPIGNKSGNEGQLLEFQITATDPEADNLTFSAANLPPGAAFDTNTATFSWTPGFNDDGEYIDVEFTVTDDGLPIALAVELITITIGNVNRAPEISNPGPQEGLEDQLLSFGISATDPDGDGVNINAQVLPSGASFDGSTFSWTPSLSQEGIYVVTFVATDTGSPSESSEIDVVITIGDNPTPSEQADNLVEDLVDADFPTNVENAYLANLKKVEKFINLGKTNPAIKQLKAFINKVKQDYNQGLITEAERDYFVAAGQNIIADLS